LVLFDTVAFGVSWVRQWNEKFEKMVFSFPFPISHKECCLCKTNSQSEAREFCIQLMKEKRNCRYRDQAIGIMGFQQKGLGLWVSNQKGSGLWEFNIKDRIMGIQHKGSGLWIYNTKDRDYGYPKQRIGIIGIQLKDRDYRYPTQRIGIIGI